MGCALGFIYFAQGQEILSIGDSEPFRIVFDGQLVDLTLGPCEPIPPPLKAKAVGGCEEPPLSKDLVLYYPFDEDLGQIVRDASGNGRTGLVNGATWVKDGALGGAVRFDNNKQTISATDAGLPSGNSPRTMAVWIKLDKLYPDGTTGLFSYGTWQWNKACGLGMDWRNDRDQFYFTQNGGVALSRAKMQQPGVWRHLAYVYDGTGQHRLYVDGVPSDGMTELRGPLNTTLSGLLMLAGHPGSIGPEGGYLDEAMIFNRALSPGEVGAVYRGALPVEVVETAAGDCPRVITRIWMSKDALGGVLPPGPIPVEFAETSAGDCPRVITRAWTAKDRCGHLASAQQTITLADETPPVLAGVPADIEVECGAEIPPPAAVTATDDGSCTRPTVPGLVVHYPFDEELGQIVQDASGNGRTATVHGATWVKDGARGGAYRFDNISQNITATDAGLPAGDAPRSMALWVKLDQFPTDPITGCLYYGTQRWNQLSGIGLDWRVGRANFYFTQCGGVALSQWRMAQAGAWHHLVYTYAGNGQHHFYVDGLPSDGMSELWGPINTVLSGSLIVGGPPETAGPRSGCLDDVQIYNRALSPEEVLALQDNAPPPEPVKVDMVEIRAGDCPGVITRIWTATDRCGNLASAMQTITVAGPVSSGDWYVATDGDDSAAGTSWASAKQTIQAAVDLAVAGNTVWVSNGVYETGTRVTPGYRLLNRVVITNDITVRSANGPEGTIIRGQGPRGSEAVRCVFMSAGHLIGFTLANGHTRMEGATSHYNENGGGLSVDPAGRGVASNCWFLQNSAYNAGGGTYGTYYNCVFRSNSAARAGGAVAVGTFYNCYMAGNSAGQYGGAIDQGTLYNCTVTGNRAANGGGVFHCWLNNSIVYDNGPANVEWVECRFTCTTPLQSGEGNIAEDPKLLPGGHIAADSPCVGMGSAAYAVGTDIDGDAWASPPAMGCDEPVGLPIPTGDWYVATDGDDSAAGTSWASAKQTIQAAVDLAKAGETVWVSNGVYETGTRVTPGHLLLNRVVITNDITVRSVNGPEVTIIRGRGPRGTNAVRGVYILAGRLIGFTIANGHTRMDGEGSHNQNGGGLNAHPSIGVVVSNCVFTGNSAYAGGGATSCTFYNCLFRENTAVRSSGGVGSATLYNCAILDNKADTFGGGADQSELYNCTIAGNSAANGGGVYNCRLYNSIVFSNAPANVAVATCRYTCTTPLQSGEGNIADDPKLLPGGHISADSPCVRMGSAADAVGTDIDGDAWASPPAMGCDEPVGIPVPTGDWYVATDGDDSAAGHTWAAAKQTIQAAVDVAQAGDTVWVSNGVYATGTRVTPGHLLMNRVVITNDITVRSVNGPETTLIRGQGPRGSNAVRCVYMTAGRLIGFTVTNGHTRLDGDGSYDQNMAGINMFPSTAAVISNCVVSGNSGYAGGGLGWGRVYNSVIRGNTAVFSAGGVGGCGGLYNCLIEGNSCVSYGGGADQGTLYNCTIVGNTAANGGGVYNCKLYNCIVYSNGPANVAASTVRYTCASPLQPGDGNIADNPKLLPDGHIAADSPCVGMGSAAYAVGTDIDGDAWASPPAMGCDEPVGVPIPLGDWYVATDGDDSAAGTSWASAKQTIQAAVDLAKAGETVWVSNGVYETGTRVTPGYKLLNRVVITNDITVRSVNGPEVTVIRGRGPRGTNAVRGVHMTVGKLIGFTVTNGHTRLDGDGTYDQNQGGINMCPSTVAVVSNCVVSGNSANSSGGTAWGRVYNTVIRGNTAVFSSGGAGGSGVLYNCLIEGNSGGSYGGGADQGTLYNCTIIGNKAANGGGVYNCKLYNCIVYSNSPANVAASTVRNTCASPLQSGEGNIADDPKLLPGGHIAADSPCVGNGSSTYAFGTDIDGDAWRSPPAMGCDEPVGEPIPLGDWYVATDGDDSAAGTSWASAKQTIQAAVDLATAGDTVWVSNGVYETGTRVTPGHLLLNRVVITNDITVRSANGPEATIIRGQGPRGSDAVRCVYMTAGRLIGFTLANGHTRMDGATSHYDENGGGLSVDPKGSGVASNCWFLGNSAYNAGGGTYGTYYNCVFRENSAARAGGAVAVGTLYNCLTEQNSAAQYGGAIDQGTLYNCTVTGNSAAQGGGTFHCWLNSSIVYDNSPANVEWVECRFTCTTPLQSGEGNIADDPKLLAGGHIAVDSPCAGKGSAAHAVGTDIDGDAWRNPPAMGCDEPMAMPDIDLDVKSLATRTISFPSSVGRLYTLQRCEDLATGTWVDVPGQTRISGSGGMDSLSDPEPHAACFYRVILESP
jgi:hypothetical protein